MTGAISFSDLIALHKVAQSGYPLASGSKSNDMSKARFTEVILYTGKLEQQLDFYSNVLEFPITSRTETQFSVEIGESKLTFKEVKDGTEPFYHYAINIPSNKHQKAKEWLASRTPLLLDSNTGEDIQYFGFWDAHAIYFKDPAGNIGELIARHTLDNDSDGEFGMTDMLCVSEIGTPVSNPTELASELKTNYGLEAYGESMFCGDENGMFVIVPTQRLWFPEYTQKASVHPTEIYLSDKGGDHYQYQDYPYKIHRKG